jgi:Transposase DDE domain
LNSKLHAVCDDAGKPMHLLLTAGPTSDYTRARCLLPSLSNAKHLIADRGYDADWFITALKKQGVSFKRDIAVHEEIGTDGDRGHRGCIQVKRFSG